MSVTATAVSKSGEPGISCDLLDEFDNSFNACPKNRLAHNACAKHDFMELAVNKSLVENSDHVYNVKLKSEGKPVTNQKSSGRCWIFALLNCMRVPLMKQLNLDELELSQNYIFFCDKLERIHYNLENYLRCARDGEAVDGRLLQHVLQNPSEDGGQWDMLVNIVEKYGVMPKSCWTETYSCEASRRMCSLLNTMTRGFARDIYKAVKEGKCDGDIRKDMVIMMQQVHKVLCICLGQPPKSFQWAYYAKPEDSKKKDDADKDEEKKKAEMEAQRLPAMTPVEFYREYVKPHMDMSQYVCLVHDPRHATNCMYTVHMLNNMTSARQVLYLNQPVNELKRLAHKMLADNKPVWFGCNVGKSHNGKAAMVDPDLYDLSPIFGHDGSGNMDKAERLNFGDSLMTHAMVFTAVDVDESGCDPVYRKWRVENSWGSDYGEKGYLSMSDTWFDQFVYEIAVDKSYLSAEVLAVLEQEPVVLPAWDPMGALARH